MSSTLLRPLGLGRSAPSDFLLATWDGGGHAGPMLSIAGALLARGNAVRVLADPVLRAEVEASGATFVPWRRAPHRRDPSERVGAVLREWEARGPVQAAARLRDALVCGAAASFAEDVADELRRRPADVVAADHLLPGALVAGQAAGARTAAIATTLMGVPQWGVPASGGGLLPTRAPLGRLKGAAAARLLVRIWAAGLPAVNAARAAHGLDPVHDPIGIFAAWDRVLVLASAGLELPTWSPPPHVRLVGARLDDPAWASPWQSPDGDGSLVLVALSSSFMDQRDLLARAAAALGRLPVRGLVTTGPAIDPADVASPPNVAVVRSAPHSVVMRHASAVVTHAGHGTTAKALAAGVPLVALPMGRDQPDIAARVAFAGAGLRLPPGSSSARIARAVQRLLDEPRYAEGARRVAAIMSEEGRQDLAVAELEALVVSAR